MFTLTCLGKNALYPTSGSPTSGYLIELNDYKILFDCGSGVFCALMRLIPPEQVDMVIISHCHFDHIGDLGVYNYYLQAKGKKLPLYIPVSKGSIDCRKYPFFTPFDISDGDNIRLKDKNIEISFFKTNHPEYCLGCSVFFENKKLVLSADTNVCDNLDKAMENASLAVLDSCFSSADYREDGPHLSAKLCAAYANRHNVKTLLSHLPADGDNSEIEAEAREASSLTELIKLKRYIL